MSSATPRRLSEEGVSLRERICKEEDLPVLEPSSIIRHVRGPSLSTSPALAGTKLMSSSGIGMPLASVAGIVKDVL